MNWRGNSVNAVAHTQFETDVIFPLFFDVFSNHA